MNNGTEPIRCIINGLVTVLLIAFSLSGATSGASWAAAGPDHISILYIESNTGDSSGGHAALRAGDDVFHFQHSAQGLLILHREQFKRFRYFYNDLGNRDIYEARLDLPPDAAGKIWEHFTRLIIRQGDMLARLSELEDELRTYVAIQRHPSEIPVKGAGLFAPNSSPDIEGWRYLNEKIVQKFGKGFIDIQLQRAERHLSALLRKGGAEREEQSVRDAVSLIAALRIIEEMPPLNSDAITGFPYEGQQELSAEEISGLKKWQAFFINSATLLLSSKRDDRGLAIMLACARYLAVVCSIKRGRLYLLKTIDQNCEEADAEELAGGMTLLKGLTLSVKKRLCAELKKIMSAAPDELRWCLFENSVSRYAELEACSRGEKHSMCIYSGTNLPAREACLDFSHLSRAYMVKAAAENAKARFATYFKRLDQQMRYNLITSNCVTELFRNIETALLQEGDNAPQGILELCRNISFIPWRMFQQVQGHSKRYDTIFYPSWRNRELARLYSNHNPVGVFLRECNTITAQTYKNGRQDSAFLFFTNDMLLARPILGACNLAYGALRTATGLLMTPFDTGSMLKSGTYGILFSFPELCFINIRKGNYSYIETGAPKSLGDR